jgi:hypothetical protein
MALAAASHGWSLFLRKASSSCLSTTTQTFGCRLADKPQPNNRKMSDAERKKIQEEIDLLDDWVAQIDRDNCSVLHPNS